MIENFEMEEIVRQLITSVLSENSELFEYVLRPLSIIDLYSVIMFLCGTFLESHDIDIDTWQDFLKETANDK